MLTLLKAMLTLLKVYVFLTQNLKDMISFLNLQSELCFKILLRLRRLSSLLASRSIFRQVQSKFNKRVSLKWEYDHKREVFCAI
jgi:hypothetical protein